MGFLGISGTSVFRVNCRKSVKQLSGELLLKPLLGSTWNLLSFSENIGENITFCNV